MILSQKNIEEIAVAVIRYFQKSFFGSEADDPARFALPTPIDQFASDYLNLKVSFQKLSSDGSIYGSFVSNFGFFPSNTVSFLKASIVLVRLIPFIDKLKSSISLQLF